MRFLDAAHTWLIGKLWEKCLHLGRVAGSCLPPFLLPKGHKKRGVGRDETVSAEASSLSLSIYAELCCTMKSNRKKEERRAVVHWMNSCGIQVKVGIKPGGISLTI